MCFGVILYCVCWSDTVCVGVILCWSDTVCVGVILCVLE